jgi:hypothetical protein
VKDTMHGGEPTVQTQRGNARRLGRRIATRCSICTHYTWFTAVPIVEPPGAPEPRQAWTLCTECHAALLEEMRRSPIRSPLRLRIAIGLVASERAPQAQPSLEGGAMSDHRWIVVLAWGFGIAMVLHLILIVMLAYVAGH